MSAGTGVGLAIHREATPRRALHGANGLPSAVMAVCGRWVPVRRIAFPNVYWHGVSCVACLRMNLPWRSAQSAR